VHIQSGLASMLASIGRRRLTQPAG